jgi:hypothetical protein
MHCMFNPCQGLTAVAPTADPFTDEASRPKLNMSGLTNAVLVETGASLVFKKVRRTAAPHRTPHCVSEGMAGLTRQCHACDSTLGVTISHRQLSTLFCTTTVWLPDALPGFSCKLPRLSDSLPG